MASMDRGQGQEVKHIIERTPLVEVEISTSAKGQIQPRVLVAGADEHVVEVAIRLYMRIQKELGGEG